MSVRLALVGIALALSAALSSTACAAPPAGDDDVTSHAVAAAGPTRRPSDPEATPATATVLENLGALDLGAPAPFDRRVILGQQEADVSNRTVNGLTKIVPDIQ